ncbi:MAG: hypothetical protein AB1442_08815 [Nitrospirota bacterium]
MEPSPFASEQYFNSEGYGANIAKDVVIFHRWRNDRAGETEKSIVVCNFLSFDQFVDIPFSSNGQWLDLLNNRVDNVNNFRPENQRVNSNRGRIYYKKDSCSAGKKFKC